MQLAIVFRHQQSYSFHEGDHSPFDPDTLQSETLRDRKLFYQFVGKLLSSTLLWCWLIFNFTKFVVLEKLSILDLAMSGVKRVKLYWIEVVIVPDQCEIRPLEVSITLVLTVNVITMYKRKNKRLLYRYHGSHLKSMAIHYK